jgi:hypothetical protein
MYIHASNWTQRQSNDTSQSEITILCKKLEFLAILMYLNYYVFAEYL